MKTIRYIVLLALCSWLFAPANAQLLYEVSGKSSKQKSYILATNRLVPMQFLDTIPNVFKCFAKCQTVITEFAMQDYEALAALRQAAVLPDSTKLRAYYDENDYAFIDNALRMYIGMGLDQLCRMKPAYLTEMVRAELLRRWLQYDEQNSMENFFETVAAQKNIPVIGLDQIGETMYMLFDREPFSWQCKELIKVLECPENEVKQERAIRDLYKQGLLTDIAYQIEGPNNTSTLSYSDYQVFCQRNTQWTKRLAPYLAQGACFITLNAIYLGGEKGLLEQLRTAGYRVRPVNRRIQLK